MKEVHDYQQSRDKRGNNRRGPNPVDEVYRCRQCGRAFEWAQSMTRHMRTHTGERPYECRAALFLCNICVVFRAVLPFGYLLFIHASTNATDDHKYSPLPSADIDIAEVLVSFSAFIFS